jgi:hypothetical protein
MCLFVLTLVMQQQQQQQQRSTAENLVLLTDKEVTFLWQQTDALI